MDYSASKRYMEMLRIWRLEEKSLVEANKYASVSRATILVDGLVLF